VEGTIIASEARCADALAFAVVTTTMARTAAGLGPLITRTRALPFGTVCGVEKLAEGRAFFALALASQVVTLRSSPSRPTATCGSGARHTLPCTFLLAAILGEIPRVAFAQPTPCIADSVHAFDVTLML